MMRRRLPETESRYKRYIESGEKPNFATRVPLKQYRHWKVINNEYPYDYIAAVHHLLIPKRAVEDPLLLKQEELDEFFLIRRLMVRDYDLFMENAPRRSSLKDWYHVHLIKLKD